MDKLRFQIPSCLIYFQMEELQLKNVILFNLLSAGLVTVHKFHAIYG